MAVVQTPTSGGGGEQRVIVQFLCSAGKREKLYQFRGTMTVTYHPHAQIEVTTFSYQYDTDDPDVVADAKNDVVASFDRGSGPVAFYDTRQKDNEDYAVPYTAPPFPGSAPNPVFIVVKAIFDIRETTDPTCTDTTAVFI